MKKKIFAAILASALVLTSCGQAEKPVNTPAEEPVKSAADEPAETTAAVADDYEYTRTLRQ